MADENEGSSDRGGPAKGSSAAGKAKPPDSVPSKPATEADLEKVENRMSGFERSTLRWTRASFVIVLATAVFICLQWLEMRSGGKDTHNLAVAAGKQADRMKDFADRMKDQADRTKDMVDQAAIQAKASKRLAQNAVDSLRMGYRPWVNAETADLMQPLAVPPMQRFYLKVNFILKNTGTSIATNSLAMAEVEPDYTDTMEKHFKKACDDTEFMRRAKQIGTPWETGFVLAPGNTLPLPVGMGSDDISGKQTINGEFYILGCVLYWDQFKLKHHTKFCFQPNRPILNPAKITFEICDWYEEAD